MLHSSTTLEDNRVYIDLCAIREMTEKGEIESVRLTLSGDQLADCLTKSTEKLVRVLEGRESIDIDNLLNKH